MYTINLTQHTSTQEQGCLDLQGLSLAKLKALLTFDALPSRAEVAVRAEGIANLASAFVVESGLIPLQHPPIKAMIGGAPFLMAALEKALTLAGITPVYAFSVRESVDEAMPDGSVKKVAVFRHKGFVPAV